MKKENNEKTLNVMPGYTDCRCMIIIIAYAANTPYTLNPPNCNIEPLDSAEKLYPK
jgi:hypothetical protein